MCLIRRRGARPIGLDKQFFFSYAGGRSETGPIFRWLSGNLNTIGARSSIGNPQDRGDKGEETRPCWFGPASGPSLDLPASHLAPPAQPAANLPTSFQQDSLLWPVWLSDVAGANVVFLLVSYPHASPAPVKSTHRVVKGINLRVFAECSTCT